MAQETIKVKVHFKKPFGNKNTFQALVTILALKLGFKVIRVECI